MADLNPKIFKAYDIRGIYPSEINEENIVIITKAIYTFFVQKLGIQDFTLALGRDMRTSSPSLFEKTKETLLSMGARIIDVGLVSTPTFYFSVYHYKYDAGIQITASHNPKEYNGIKYVLNTPQGLLKIGKPTGMEDVKAMAMAGVPDAPTGTGTIVEKTGIQDDEVQNAIDLLENPEIKPFKVVADPGNAMAATYIDAFFKKVPGELIRMNFELDGTFPVHQPDPMQPENLVDIQKRVLEEGADVGLAPDGDGDRLFIIDEKGQVVPPSMIVGILSRELLAKHPGGKVIVDIKYNLGPRKVVEEYGGELLISKTGHAFITELINQTGAIFAGEASAHYYYKATGGGESQVITILSILKIMTEEQKPLSEIAEEFRRSYESGEINFEVENAPEIMEQLKGKYQDVEISELDGVALSHPEWRISLRSSNTEPLLRLNVEALTKETMVQKRDEVKQFIQEVGKHVENPSHH